LLDLVPKEKAKKGNISFYTFAFVLTIFLDKSRLGRNPSPGTLFRNPYLGLAREKEGDQFLAGRTCQRLEAVIYQGPFQQG
jgi:hypothetical protein